MAGASKLEKASIYNVDTDQEVVKCLFNPTEYTFTKTNSWQPARVMGQNLPIAQFLGGGAWTLTMSLFFDSYGDDDPADIRDHTEKVVKLMKIDPKLKDPKNKEGRPPRVLFRWGQSWSFKAVISSITQRFTLFLPNGTPVRATLDVTFQQVEEDGTYPKTNPTSYAEVQKVHVVVPGETIDAIAFEEYGDSALWKLIADHNELDDPLRLRPGQRLAIPAAP